MPAKRRVGFDSGTGHSGQSRGVVVKRYKAETGHDGFDTYTDDSSAPKRMWNAQQWLRHGSVRAELDIARQVFKSDRIRFDDFTKGRFGRGFTPWLVTLPVVESDLSVTLIQANYFIRHPDGAAVAMVAERLFQMWERIGLGIESEYPDVVGMCEVEEIEDEQFAESWKEARMLREQYWSNSALYRLGSPENPLAFTIYRGKLGAAVPFPMEGCKVFDMGRNIRMGLVRPMIAVTGPARGGPLVLPEGLTREDIMGRPGPARKEAEPEAPEQPEPAEDDMPHPVMRGEAGAVDSFAKLIRDNLT